MAADTASTPGPRLSRAGLEPVHEVEAYNNQGRPVQVFIPGETPLTLKVDGREVVTLMTLGTNPEELALGYLRNQHLVQSIEDIDSVEVNWDRETVNVATRHGQGIEDLEEKLSRVTVTTGCGQGTVFSCTVDKLYELKLPRVEVRQSQIYALLRKLAHLNQIYRQAGSVHGCALCQDEDVVMYVEDVGRHNATDVISGRMWLDKISGTDKILYTTGRLTSEIVMKSAFMGIPVLLSRSGVTQMGLQFARDLGAVIIARAKATRLLVYHGADQVIFDAPPDPSPAGD